MKICKRCNNEFEGATQKRYCSKECSVADKNEKRRKSPQILKCVICEKEFVQKRKDNLTCSLVCGRKLWIKNNPEKSANCDKGINRKKRFEKWRENNRDKLRKTKQKYKANRRKKDVNFKINELIGNSIRSSVRNKGFKKWSEILGYDIETLKVHLEKTLPKNITWEIYLKSNNEFHIDHIVPISAYNFNTYEDEDFKKCWNYRNLRIISKKENLTKLSNIKMELIEKFNIKDLLPKDFKFPLF
jgi:hypothetical protein